MASPYGALSTQVNNAIDDLNNQEDVILPQREAEELFLLPDGAVQIFFVRKDGNVSTFSSPSALRIFRFKDLRPGEETSPVFIQVDGWSHPLIPGASPVLEAANGAFMFPDVYSEEVGGAVGVVVSDEVEPAVRDQLRKVLEEFTALRTDASLPDDQRLGSIGKTLVKGAEYLSQGMEFGAQKACELIEYVGEREKAKSEAAATDSKVGAHWKYSAKGAKYATHATVKVSGFVANRVGRLTKGLANYLATKIEKPVGAIVGPGSSSTGEPPRSGSISKGLADAARGGLIAYGTVYAGLEESAKQLGGCLKDQSVSVVEHRYGGSSAKVYGDGMTAAGNAAMTYMNVSSLGVKGLVKKTAKDTGKNVAKGVIEAHANARAGGGDEPKDKVAKME